MIIRNFFKIIIVFIILSCEDSNKDDLEIKLLNDNVISYSKGFPKDTVNIIKYCIKNNSNTTYFFNNFANIDSLRKKYAFNNGVNLRIYNSNGEEVKYLIKRSRNKDVNVNDLEKCVELMFRSFRVKEQRLGYNKRIQYFEKFDNNCFFFIHPKEILFFEISMSLKNPMSFEGVREGFVELDLKNKYYSIISLASDSTNYKNILPRDILQTIKENNIKVYHGLLESKNKIPLKIIK